MSADSQTRAREQMYWRNAELATREGRYLDAFRWEALAQWQRDRNQQ